MRRDEARLGEVRRDEAGCSENAARCLFCSKMSYVVWLLVLPAHGLAAQSSHTSQLWDAWLLTATPNACAGRGECVRAHCGCVRIVCIVAGLLLLVGSVLCV